MKYRRRGMAIALAWCVSVAALSEVPQSAAVSSRQQQFDQASDALDRQDGAAALAGFDALAKTITGPSKGSILTVIQLRKARALHILGRDDEALPLLSEGLTALPDTPNLREDRALGLTAKAQIEESTLDYASARNDYMALKALADSNYDRLIALIGITRTAMFDDPAGALAAIDQSFALNPAEDAKSKDFEGQLYTMRGRVRLNQGDFKGAMPDLKKALALLGGLTERVTLSDIAARSDLAIASLLVNDKESARKYLTYTGAGHLDELEAIRSADFELPPCGGASHAEPQDFAIVEFSILDDGTVGFAQPVYRSRAGVDVLEFARIVRNWSWPAAQAQSIKPFFRQAIRFQLRCSTITSPPAPTAFLEDDMLRWLADHKVVGFEPKATVEGARLAELQAELMHRERAGREPVALVPILMQIAANKVATKEDADAAARRAVEIGRAANAPGRIRALLVITAEETQWRRSDRQRTMARGRSIAQALLATLDDPKIAEDARSRAILRLSAADILMDTKRDGDALETLRPIATDGALDPHDPLKVGALIRISSLEVRAGQIDAAREAFEASGLGAGQCALVDAQPALRSAPNGPNSFPHEAQMWGFEGWAKLEFDIDAQGKTANVRPVTLYPPFVFGEAATTILRQAHYTQSYRPGGGLGCGGQHASVRFGIPGIRR